MNETAGTVASRRTALILRGISFRAGYKHQSGVSYDVDYRRSVSNLRKSIPFEHMDVYLSTDSHAHIDQLLRTFSPVAHHIATPDHAPVSPYVAIARHLRRCFAEIRASGKAYDDIIVTRFDLILEYPIAQLQLVGSKFNFVCFAENNDLIDDNLWIFPFSMMDEIDGLMAQVEVGKIEKTHEIIQYMERKSTNALFTGNYYLMQDRPYIKFQREIGHQSVLRNLRIKMIHMGINRHSIRQPQFYIDQLKNRVRGPRRELAWRLYGVQAQIKKLLYPNPPGSRLHFLTFYTEGFPRDNGLDLRRSCARLINAMRPFTDSVDAFNVTDLRRNPSTAVYVKEFDEVAPYNVGTNKIGFLRWKPYLILEALKKADDGDIVFYRDCNVEKYPHIMYKAYEIRACVGEVLRVLDTDFYAPTEHFPRLKVKQVVKREVLEALGILSEASLEEFLHNASIIVCRKTSKTMALMQEWMELCMDDQLLSPDTGKAQHYEFHHNTQEQAILNGLLTRDRLQEDDYSKPLGISVFERAFAVNSIARVPRVAVLYCGQLRNFDNRDVLFHNHEKLLGLYNCDVFASVWDTRGYSLNHGHAVEADYARNRDVSERKIKAALEYGQVRVRAAEIENFDAWLSEQKDNVRQLYSEGMPVGPKRVLATSFPQLYKIEQANKLKTQYENANGFKYDIVIRMRPDMLLVESIPDHIINNMMKLKSPTTGIYHLNPPRIFYPDRVYDIFFFGSSQDMDVQCSAWSNVQRLLEDPFDNGLPKVDACRLLYVQDLRNGLKVHDIPRCIGDIYRDEPVEVYFDKILHEFN